VRSSPGHSRVAFMWIARRDRCDGNIPRASRASLRLRRRNAFGY
jgi:hypothetical protein